MKPNMLIVTSSGTENGKVLPPSYFHRESVKAGYSRCIHHVVIGINGEIHRMRPMDEPGIALKGKALSKFNKHSWSVCLMGTDKYSDAQMESIKATIAEAKMMCPDLQVLTFDELCERMNQPTAGKPGFPLKDFIHG